MIRRKLAISFAVGIACVGFVACNEDVEAEVEQTTRCAAVNSFSLAEDKDVLENLDSVFFAIDLNKGEIFNADSLPYGTNVTKLIPVITTLDGASLIKLTVTRPNNTDTVFDYLNNSTDSIDFTNPVKLRVVSPDGITERNYTVRVNVHKVKADSLVWDRAERTSLPSLFNYPNEQHTTQQGDKLFCLTRYQSDYSLAAGIPDGEWEKRNIAFPFKPQIDSFTATDNAFYILAEDGTLYTSTDCEQWTSTSLRWHAIYGAYNETLLGSVESTDGWNIQQYPSLTLSKLPEGMPVSGTSMPVSYTFSMSLGKQILFIGGRKIDGKLSNATWGFDGKNWACISKKHLPEALENVIVAPYYTSIINGNHNTVTYPTIMAIGGKKTDGTLSKTVYVSNDYGYTWQTASILMQLPEYMPTTHSAQAFVFESILNANSRVSKPIESWECPYIYIFGGINAAGATQNTVWRGVINRLSFKPLQ